MTVNRNTDASSVIANKTYYSQNLANCPNPDLILTLMQYAKQVTL